MPTLRARGGHGGRGRPWLRGGGNGHKLNRRVRLAHDDTWLVGKGRRPRGSWWSEGSNPAPCCFISRGRNRGWPGPREQSGGEVGQAVGGLAQCPIKMPGIGEHRHHQRLGQGEPVQSLPFVAAARGRQDTVQLAQEHDDGLFVHHWGLSVHSHHFTAWTRRRRATFCT
jgi:hypothetical protein